MEIELTYAVRNDTFHAYKINAEVQKEGPWYPDRRFSRRLRGLGAFIFDSEPMHESEN